MIWNYDRKESTQPGVTESAWPSRASLFPAHWQSSTKGRVKKKLQSPQPHTMFYPHTRERWPMAPASGEQENPATSANSLIPHSVNTCCVPRPKLGSRDVRLTRSHFLPSKSFRFGACLDRRGSGNWCTEWQRASSPWVESGREKKSPPCRPHHNHSIVFSVLLFLCMDIGFSFTRQLVHTCYVPGPSPGIRGTAINATQIGPVRGLQSIEGHSESQQKLHSMIRCVRMHAWHYGTEEGHLGQVTSTAPNGMKPQERRNVNGVKHSRQRGTAHTKAQRWERDDRGLWKPPVVRG